MVTRVQLNWNELPDVSQCAVSQNFMLKEFVASFQNRWKYTCSSLFIYTARHYIWN